MRYLKALLGLALLSTLLGMGCPFTIRVNATNSNLLDVTVRTFGDGVLRDESTIPGSTNQELYQVEFEELPSEVRFVVDGVLLSGDTDKTFLDPLPFETFTITVLANGSVEITRSSGLTAVVSEAAPAVSSLLPWPFSAGSETTDAKPSRPAAAGRGRR